MLPVISTLLRDRALIIHDTGVILRLECADQESLTQLILNFTEMTGYPRKSK
jgi:hypothetical protein